MIVILHLNIFERDKETEGQVGNAMMEPKDNYSPLRKIICKVTERKTFPSITVKVQNSVSQSVIRRCMDGLSNRGGRREEGGG